MVFTEKRKSDFADVDAFLAYALPHSVFLEDELRGFWVNWNRLYVAKMTYNAALNRRVIRLLVYSTALLILWIFTSSGLGGLILRIPGWATEQLRRFTDD